MSGGLFVKRRGDSFVNFSGLQRTLYWVLSAASARSKMMKSSMFFMTVSGPQFSRGITRKSAIIRKRSVGMNSSVLRAKPATNLSTASSSCSSYQPICSSVVLKDASSMSLEASTAT
eukprot:888395_1